MMVKETHYYPFGMTMPGRNFATQTPYRYGFNGQENDKELNAIEFNMREYDPRNCRLIGIDPLAKDYPYLSPYQFAGNTPLQAIDLLGMQPGAATIPRVSTSPSLGTMRVMPDGSVYIPVNGPSGNTYVQNAPYGTFFVNATPNLSNQLQQAKWQSGFAPGSSPGTAPTRGGPIGDIITNPNAPVDQKKMCELVGLNKPMPLMFVNNTGTTINNQTTPFALFQTQTQVSPTPPKVVIVDPRTQKPNNGDSHLYKTEDVQKNSWSHGLDYVANGYDKPLPYIGITTSKILGGRYAIESLRGSKSKLLATADLHTIQGAETAIIALNTYGLNYKSHLTNLNNQDVRASTRIGNLTFSHKQTSKILLGIKLLNGIMPGWDKATGANSLLFPENKKGTNHPSIKKP
jgi:RHS repeat-associated protein